MFSRQETEQSHQLFTRTCWQAEPGFRGPYCHVLSTIPPNHHYSVQNGCQGSYAPSITADENNRLWLKCILHPLYLASKWQNLFGHFPSLKVTAMNEFADRLCGEGHYEGGEIRTRQRTVLKRRSKVKGAAVERRNKLEDCRKLMVFLQNVMEVSWEALTASISFVHSCGTQWTIIMLVGL